MSRSGCCTRHAPKPAGGMNKIPFQPNGRPASSTDPATWSDFGTVWSAYEEDMGGLRRRRLRAHQARPLYRRGPGPLPRRYDRRVDPPGRAHRRGDRDLLGGHTERNRLAVLGTGEAGRSFRGRGIEVYTTGRFLTVTGQRIGDVHEPVPIPAAAVARLHELATGARDNGAGAPGGTTDPIIARLQAAGLYQRRAENGRHLVTCPWWETHSGGTSPARSTWRRITTGTTAPPSSARTAIAPPSGYRISGPSWTCPPNLHQSTLNSVG